MTPRKSKQRNPECGTLYSRPSFFNTSITWGWGWGGGLFWINGMLLPITIQEQYLDPDSKNTRVKGHFKVNQKILNMDSVLK